MVLSDPNQYTEPYPENNPDHEPQNDPYPDLSIYPDPASYYTDMLCLVKDKIIVNVFRLLLYICP